LLRYKVLAELLELGSRSSLKIPVHTPALPQASSANTAAARIEADAIRVIGINPSHALQHPGFYYYMAARCTEMRRERLLAAVEVAVSCSGQGLTSIELIGINEFRSRILRQKPLQDFRTSRRLNTWSSSWM
jgi:hypothetical protein